MKNQRGNLNPHAMNFILLIVVTREGEGYSGEAIHAVLLSGGGSTSSCNTSSSSLPAGGNSGRRVRTEGLGLWAGDARSVEGAEKAGGDVADSLTRRAIWQGPGPAGRARHRPRTSLWGCYHKPNPCKENKPAGHRIGCTATPASAAWAEDESLLSPPTPTHEGDWRSISKRREGTGEKRTAREAPSSMARAVVNR